MDIREELWKRQDKEYAAFQVKLTPGITLESCIGVRVPEVRRLAKLVKKEPECCKAFLDSLPHSFYDENMLHSVLLSEISSFEECVERIQCFLPYVDNWAVCDSLKPKAFKKHKEDLIPYIKEWISSKEEYTCRFGIEMLMTYYLDEDFKAEYLKLPSEVISDKYYINMMIAWYFATALAKQWDATVPYLEKQLMPKWVHNKSIQKALESYRITKEQKDYLRTLKIK